MTRGCMGIGLLMLVVAGCRAPAPAGGSGDVATVRGAVSVSGELILDAPVVGSSIFSRSPAVAFDGTNFLVVYGDQHGNDTNTVSAVRVSPAGTIIDSPSVIVGNGDSASPAVAFGGGRTMVTWADNYNYEVFVRPVGTNGQPLGTALRVAANDFADEYDPTVAFDGTNFVVAFVDSNNRNKIVASRVSPTGTLVDTTPKVIFDGTSSSNYLYAPRLAFDGTNYQLVWQVNTSGAKVIGLRFTPALAVVAGSMATLSPAAAYSAAAPALAFTGGQHLLAWAEQSASTDTTSAIRAARLDPSGTVSTPVTVGPAAAGNNTPAVAVDGTGWLVAWTQSSGTFPNIVASVHAARVDATGALADAAPALVSDAPGSKATAAAACGGGTCLTAWADERTYFGGIYGARLTAGTNLDPGGIRIGSSYNFEIAEAIASRGADYLVTWVDTRDGGRTIYGARVDGSGTTLDVPARRISNAIDPTGVGYPAAASDGTNYLVIWDGESASSLGISLVDGATGAPGAVHALPVDSYKPALVFAGSQYFGAWNGHPTAGSSDYAILGVRFDRQGNAIDATPINVTTPSSTFSDNVKIATDGTDFLAVWQTGDTTFGARVDKNGQVLDSPPLAVRPSDVTGYQSSPGVAFDGTSYLVIWTDTKDSIRGAHVGRDGSMPDATSLPLLVAGNNTLYEGPSIAFDSTNFLVAYHRDDFDQTSHWTGALMVGAFSPTLAYVSGGGVTNVCPNCVAITTNPTIAAGKGQGLMGFIRPDMSLGYELDRVRMVMFTETPVQGSPCTGTASCPTGQFCVYGVCCDTACAGGTKDCQACSVSAGAAHNGTCGPVVTGQSCTAGPAAGV